MTTSLFISSNSTVLLFAVMIKKSFSPILPPEPRILLLGSLPGDLSLQEQKYYAHPQNRFWKVISILFGEQFISDYNERQYLLTSNRIALWDVCAQAERKGSMDNNILHETPNDVNALIIAHASLEIVAFNGLAAQKLYHRYFEQIEEITYFTLPSTSPANAQFSLERLTEHWRKALI